MTFVLCCCWTLHSSVCLLWFLLVIGRVNRINTSLNFFHIVTKTWSTLVYDSFMVVKFTCRFWIPIIIIIQTNVKRTLSASELNLRCQNSQSIKSISRIRRSQPLVSSLVWSYVCIYACVLRRCMFCNTLPLCVFNTSQLLVNQFVDFKRTVVYKAQYSDIYRLLVSFLFCWLSFCRTRPPKRKTLRIVGNVRGNF